MEQIVNPKSRPPVNLRAAEGSLGLPSLPWRDPHTVPPEKLAEVIANLKDACAQHPENSALHTGLGMAYAMNYEVYNSMAALESALAIAPRDFFARLKYGELFFRLRVRNRAEQETLRALELAGRPWELSLARTQLAQIRQLDQGGQSRPEWTKSLRLPIAGFVALLALVAFAYMFFK
jgi:hypothetical protein